jgi:hypothetical protein
MIAENATVKVPWTLKFMAHLLLVSSAYSGLRRNEELLLKPEKIKRTTARLIETKIGPMQEQNARHFRVQHCIRFNISSHEPKNTAT